MRVTGTAAWIGAVALALFGASGACDRGHDASEPVLDVFAASSLTEAMTAIARDFDDTHPGGTTRLQFAGSQALRLQVEQGAPADVYASADPRHVEALADGGLISERSVFATSTLVLAVHDDSRIVRLDDLADAGRIVVGAPDSPVGRYTRQFLERLAARDAGLVVAIEDRIASEEVNVRLVRAKLQLGEADAAFLYASDVASAPGLRAVRLDSELAPRGTYEAAVVATTDDGERARAFVAYLGSDAARAQLAAHGLDAVAP